MQKKGMKKGFTIVELIVVIVIIGILAAILIPNLGKWIEQAYYSSDVALVTNINKVLAVEEILDNSPNDAIELEHLLEEHGLNLKTKSTGNYLFYSKKSGRAVLASLNESGIEVKAGVDASDYSGKYLKEILSPEEFIDGYLFITTESKDGFAEAICGIRNGEDFSNNLSKIENKNADLHSAINVFVNTTLFINEEGIESTAGIELSSVTHICISKNATGINLTDNFDTSNENIQNLSILDIPSNITSMNEKAIEFFAKKIELNSSLVTFNNDALLASLTDKAQTNQDAEIIINSNNFIKVSMRDDSVVTFSIIEYDEKDSENSSKILKQAVIVNGKVNADDFANYRGHTTDLESIKYWQFLQFRDEEDNIIDLNNLPNGGLYNVYREWEEKDYNGEDFYLYLIPTNQQIEVYLKNDMHTKMSLSDVVTGSYVVTGTDITIDKDLIIPENVTFIVKNDTFENMLTKASTEYTFGYSICPAQVENADNAGQQLTINEGITLTNNGTLIVGSDIVTTNNIGHENDDYNVSRDYYNNCSRQGNNYATLVNNGIINSNGKISAYGPVTGNGTINQLNNSYETLITMEDWKGFVNALQSLTVGLMPFTKWHTSTIENTLNISKSGKFNLFGAFDFAGLNVTVSVPIIGNENSVLNYGNDALITIHNEDKLRINVNGDLDDDILTINFDFGKNAADENESNSGISSDNPVITILINRLLGMMNTPDGKQLLAILSTAMDLIGATGGTDAVMQAGTIGINLPLQGIAFPLSNVDIYINSGTTRFDNCSYKFMPNTSLTINEESTLHLDGNQVIEFYDDENDPSIFNINGEFYLDSGAVSGSVKPSISSIIYVKNGINFYQTSLPDSIVISFENSTYSVDSNSNDKYLVLFCQGGELLFDPDNLLSSIQSIMNSPESYEEGNYIIINGVPTVN